MKVGILGAGFVGQSMATALISVGHDVVLSSREPASQRMQEIVARLGTRAQAATVVDTCAQAEIVFLALRWDAIPEAVDAVGDWDGKILIDAANDLGHSGSPTAELQAMTPDARVVKCFNTIGAEHYQDPLFQGRPATMLLCGEDADANATVAALAGELGFDPVDLGGLDKAPLLDAVAALWIDRMFQTDQRDFAFMLMPKGR